MTYPRTLVGVGVPADRLFAQMSKGESLVLVFSLSPSDHRVRIVGRGDRDGLTQARQEAGRVSNLMYFAVLNPSTDYEFYRPHHKPPRQAAPVVFSHLRPTEAVRVAGIPLPSTTPFQAPPTLNHPGSWSTQ